MQISPALFLSAFERSFVISMAKSRTKSKFSLKLVNPFGFYTTLQVLLLMEQSSTETLSSSSRHLSVFIVLYSSLLF